jgi:CTP:molybdopterin cytidylyltransferase MocA
VRARTSWSTVRVVEMPGLEAWAGRIAPLRATELDADAAVVVLADGPGLDPRAVDRVVESWRDGAGERSRHVRRREPLASRPARPLDVGRRPDDGARSRSRSCRARPSPARRRRLLKRRSERRELRLQLDRHLLLGGDRPDVAAKRDSKR